MLPIILSTAYQAEGVRTRILVPYDGCSKSQTKPASNTTNVSKFRMPIPTVSTNSNMMIRGLLIFEQFVDFVD